MTQQKPSLSLFKQAQKRCFDVLLSLFVILFLAPLFAVVAIILKTTSPGPVIYKNARVGKGGRIIYCYKFRTMHINSDDYAINKSEIDADPRYTSFGKFLRVTSLDEIPQFFNVINGDMSVVGPRAMVPAHYDIYSKEYWLVDDVKPGLTGPTQIKLFEDKKAVLTIDEIIKIESSYVSNWSLWLDMKIILKTVFIGISKDGGY